MLTYVQSLTAFKDDTVIIRNELILQSEDGLHIEVFDRVLADEHFVGELVAGKYDSTQLFLSDITIYDEGKGFCTKVLEVLFQILIEEKGEEDFLEEPAIVGESLSSAESYWEQYTNLTEELNDSGYREFQITLSEFLNSSLYQRYKTSDVLTSWALKYMNLKSENVEPFCQKFFD